MTNMPQHTILIVDDAPENIHVLMDTLRDDYPIMVAKDGEKALLAIEKGPLPDLILLDIIMPGIDGYEVCRRLKAQERTRDIPIIFITALNQEEDETRGLKLGAIDYITKPFCPGIVKARVRNHIALREAAHFREDIDRILRHDLRTPLNAIITVPQLLLDDSLTPEQKELLTLLLDTGRRMLKMIDTSLILHKIEAGQYHLTSDRLNLKRLLEGITVEMNHAFASRRLSLQILREGLPACGDDHLFIHGEEVLCTSLLENLIKNACEASPEGERVVVSLFTQLPCHVVAITNRGEVPPAIRSRFFEKYVTEGKKQGTGLGTYSARLAAEAHGGSIELDSTQEGSTTVIVRLPASSDPAGLSERKK